MSDIMYRYFIFTLFCLCLTACQSAPIEGFSSVKKGMRKDQVLELVGGPKHSRRWKGRDRWTYIFLSDESENIKEVVFKEGKVIYVGDQVPPKVTAEDQDQANEQSNAAVIAEENKRRLQFESDWQEYNKGTPQTLPQFNRVK